MSDIDLKALRKAWRVLDLIVDEGPPCAESNALEALRLGIDRLESAERRAEEAEKERDALKERIAVEDGWKLVKVKEQEFEDLMYWLDRCDSHGHLERASDLVEPWAAFDWREVAQEGCK